MPHKPIRMTGPRQFHLTGSKSHHPTINLAGEKETKAGDKIPFDDERKKKLAWMSNYVAASSKVAATIGDGDIPDQDYWNLQAKDQQAKQTLYGDLTKQLGRAPTDEEFNAQWNAHSFSYRHHIDKPDARLNAATSSMEVDPNKVQAGQQAHYDQQVQRWNAMSDQQRSEWVNNGGTPPAPHGAGLETGLDEQGQEKAVSNPDIINAPTYAAEQAKRQALESRSNPIADYRAGAGGSAGPVGRIFGPAFGELADIGGGVLSAYSKQPVDANGRLTRLPSVNQNPSQESMATGLDERARLMYAYNKAVETGDEDTARTARNQLATLKWKSIPQTARENVDRSALWNTASGVGNTAATSAGTGAMNWAARLGKIPLPIVSALTQVAAPLALAGAVAPRGQSWDAVKGMAAPTAAMTAQNLGTQYAVSKAMPNITRSLVGGTTSALDRVPAAGRFGAVKNLLTNPARLRALGGNAAAIGTLSGGINSTMDLGHQLWNMNNSEDEVGIANDQAVGNQALADEGTGTLGRIGHSAGAATKALLTGDINDARQQFGASYGRMLPNTRAGRAVQSAKREMYSTNQAQQGYDQTLNALGSDPRFNELDPSTASTIARLGAEHAGSAGTLDFNRGINEQVGTDWLGRYSQARQKIIQSQPLTPSEASMMEELTGAQRGSDGRMQLTNQQYQLAVQNAALYHRVGPNNARQILAGHLPGEMTGRGGTAQRNQPHLDTVSYAQGATPNEALQAKRGPANSVQPPPAVIPPGPGAAKAPQSPHPVSPPIAQTTPQPPIPHT